MGYRVEYGPLSTSQTENGGSGFRVGLMSFAFFLAFCMAVSSLWPQGREAAANLLFPGGSEIAVEAAEGFVTELQSGVPLRSALEDFCREILEHGDLS